MSNMNEITNSLRNILTKVNELPTLSGGGSGENSEYELCSLTIEYLEGGTGYLFFTIENNEIVCRSVCSSFTLQNQTLQVVKGSYFLINQETLAPTYLSFTFSGDITCINAKNNILSAEQGGLLFLINGNGSIRANF